MDKLIVANWKSNPLTENEAIKLAQNTDIKGAVIAPPFIFLEAVKKVLKNAALGAQDVSASDVGAHTGEVSWHQLSKLGVSYVIIGHSERRALGETDEMINKKFKAAISAGLKVILCVGENREIRDKGIESAKQFVAAQLKKGLTGTDQGIFKQLIIAYEPIWAIGTGQPDSPESAAEMARFIKQHVSVPVLYGGSVNSANAKSFLSQSEIDGALVGGASLKPEEFKGILTNI